MATITGGEKLLAQLREMTEQVGKPITLRVGFLEGATYPDKSKDRLREIYRKRDQKLNDKPLKGAVGGVSVAMVAAINEFGAPSRSQPPRPFFRTMIAEKKGSWAENVKALLLFHEYNGKKVLQLMGEEISADLRDSIRDFSDPPLKPSTFKAKGFDKPLIDTAHMLHSVAYDVK